MMSGLYPESLIRETGFDALLMDFGLGPDERLGVGIVGIDERIDVLPELFDRGEGCSLQRLPLQDREPFARPQ